MLLHNYADCLYHTKLKIVRFPEQGYVGTRLKSSLQKYYGGNHEFVDRYSVSIGTMGTELFSVIFYLSSFVHPSHDFLWVTQRVFLER